MKIEISNYTTQESELSGTHLFVVVVVVVVVV